MLMDRADWWWGDVWKTLAVLFISFLIIFHLLLWLYLKSKCELKLWKFVDYIWVSITAFTICLYTIDFGRFQAKIVYDLKENEWRSWNEQIVGYFDWMERYLCHTQWIRTEHSSPNWDEIGERLRKGCSFAQEAQQIAKCEIEKKEPDFKPSQFESGKSVLEAALGQSYIRSVFDNLDRQYTRTRELGEWRDRTGITAEMLSVTLKYYALLALSIAFPMRLTKVTADLKDAK